MLTPGDVVDRRYRVERAIGAGGMGAVYAVVDSRDGSEVALKVLLDATDALLCKRFLREGEAAAQLQTEHVPKIYGTGMLESGAPYLLMELLHGSDLGEVVHREGPLAPDVAITYVLQAGEALSEAHARGMVHRDVKPANLFLQTLADGRRTVKLLDFGISKTALSKVAPMTQLTQTGTVLGSPEYMSPEQLVSSSDVDQRADIWSLGATLQELLTARQAFEGSTLAEVVTAIMRDPPIPLRQLRPDLSPQLEAVVRRCLEKDPELRYGSIEELASWLRSARSSDLSTSDTLVAPSRHRAESHDRIPPPGPSRPDIAHAPTNPHGSQAPALAPPPATPTTPTTAPGPVEATRPRFTRWVLGAGALIASALIGGAVVMATMKSDEPNARDDDAQHASPRDAKLSRKERTALEKKLARAERSLTSGDIEEAADLAADVEAAIESAGMLMTRDRSPLASRAAVIQAQASGERSVRFANRFDAMDAQATGKVHEHLSWTNQFAYRAFAWDRQNELCARATWLDAYRDVVVVLFERYDDVADFRHRISFAENATAIAHKALVADDTTATYRGGDSKACERKCERLRARLVTLKNEGEALRADGYP